MLGKAILFLSLLVLATPEAVASSTISFVDKVIVAESSGDPQARPRDPETGELLSSAFGAGQFVEATWLAMVRKYRPDLAARPDEEILDMRGDFALSREMTVHYADENRIYLLKKGLKPTYAALYLAHFAGAYGAAKLLKAHRDTSVEDILSAEAIAANGFLEGKSVAMVYAWANAKMDVEESSPDIVLASSDGETPRGSISKPAPRASDRSAGEMRIIRGGVVQIVAREAS